MIRFLIKERLAEKEFKEKRRITLDELSGATGISKNTLSRIQSSYGYNTSTDNIGKLCAYFGCTPGDLLVYVPDEE